MTNAKTTNPLAMTTKSRHHSCSRGSENSRRAPSIKGNGSGECPEPFYAIITPARDEEAYIEDTIRCVIGQTVHPVAWVIVNDGSKDRTGEIINHYEVSYPWIHALHRSDRGFRAAGSGVMETFYAGLDVLPFIDWDFLVKLDADLSFPADYFKRCFEKFASCEKLGIGGGIIMNLVDGELKEEKHPYFHVRGATKIYRRGCWDAIDGLIRLPGWDTLDEVKANMLGWESRSFHDLKLVQHRFTGDAAGQWSNWVKNGRACYISGYHPLFLLARALNCTTKRPFLKATVGILYGYFRAMANRIHQVDDPNLIRYVKGQQIRRLFGLRSIWR
jgi:glycosyltransferase involved in cell wall biosynthesis